MITSTNHVNQVNKPTSQMTSTKFEFVKQKELFHSAKVAWRQVVKEAASQKEKLEIDIKYLNVWIMEMAEEVKDAKRTAKYALRKASKSSFIMSNRLKRLKDLKFLVGDLKEELPDESHLLETLHRMDTIRLQINHEITIGRKIGSLRWQVYIFILICELLVNGTPPSVIPANIQKCLLLLLEVKWMI